MTACDAREALRSHRDRIKVGVVVLSWNRRSRVLDCIARIERLDTPAIDVTIVIVDNASSDDSVDAFRAGHPDAVILPQAVNLGFVGGVNTGLAEVLRRQLDYAWLLNDDTQFEDDILAKLVDHARRSPGASVFSPVIRDDDAGRQLQFRNGLVDWHRCRLHDQMEIDRFSDLVRGGATPVLIGTALLIATPVIDAVIGFDERFFAYWEDIDFTVRAAHRGFVSQVVVEATVLHDSPDRNARPPHYYYYMIRNEALFWKKHTGAFRPGWQRRWLANALIRLGENRDLGNARNAQACVDGVWDGLIGRHGQRVVDRPAPVWFRRLMSAHPHLAVLVLEGRVGPIVRRITRRRTKA